MAARLLTPAERVGFVAAAGLLAVLPDFVGAFDVVRLTIFMIYAMLALSLGLIWGCAGILSFGQAALFGIGGYVYGIVGINSGSPLLALIGGAAAPVVVAGLLGYACFYGRVGPIYFAVITLTVTLILHQVMGSTADPRYAVGAARLGGYNGMTMIPALAVDLPGLSGQPLSPRGLFRFVAAVLLAVLIGCLVLTRTSFGRVLQGIRENERRAELLGYDIRWRKLAVFMVSAAVAGLAGALFAAWGNFINPEVFSLPQAALVVIWVLVGGRGTLYGAVVGAVVVQGLTAWLGAAGSIYTTVLLGGILVAIVLFFSHGLVPALWRAGLGLGRLGRSAVTWSNDNAGRKTCR